MYKKFVFYKCCLYNYFYKDVLCTINFLIFSSTFRKGIVKYFINLFFKATTPPCFSNYKVEIKDTILGGGDTCTGFPSRPIAMQLHLSMHTLIGVKTGWEGRSKYFAWFVYTTKEKSGVRSTIFLKLLK